jgi:drug/metabolite transporter (DMT)-like permease
MSAACHLVSVGLAVGIGRPVLLSSHAAPTRWSAAAMPAMVLKTESETRMRRRELERIPWDEPPEEEETHALQTEEDAGSGPSPGDSTSEGVVEGRLLMLLVACLWGTNFPAVKAILEAGLSPSLAAAARFGLAALALSPLLKQGPKLERDLITGGFECGAWLALGYIAQALALRDTPSAVVAFMASLQVVLVPLTLAALGKGKLSPRLILSCLLCVGGVGLLELGPLLVGMLSGAPTEPRDVVAGAAALSAGSALALLQPVGFGVSYIRIEALMKRFPEGGLQLSALQLISNAAIAFAWFGYEAFSDRSVLHGLMEKFNSITSGASQVPTGLVAGVAYTGLISTALTVVLQTRALSKLPAADSSVIVATEPLWAAGFATLLLGEMLAPSSMFGGMMLLTGCLANTVLPEQLTAPAQEDRGKEEFGREKEE